MEHEEKGSKEIKKQLRKERTKIEIGKSGDELELIHRGWAVS